MTGDAAQVTPARRQQVKSLSRSTEILRVLADRPMRPAELSRELGQPWATIYRSIRVLAQEGVLQRDLDTGEYSIGPTLWSLATTYLRDHAVMRVGLGHLDHAIVRIPGLVKVTERHDAEAVTLFAEQNPQASPVTRIREQYRLPLHVASFGHLLLAFAGADVIEAYLQRPLVAYSQRTVTDPSKLAARLREIKDVGYAASLGELQHENGSISVPIRARDGEVIAALTAVLPIPLLKDADVFSEQLDYLTDTARNISEALGCLNYAQFSSKPPA
ncbi:IclR family transcriptional regulator [Ornithinimicrobium sufpigmenti]|uniref:IclR family transcriptional regulator n=1 Tax=Ornithinimicrobium sufpigmenti TaxID=2508882 RepID=UPI00103596BE|nr:MULTISPECIES: IclR family transcriptional regulator [unclassified Ornithinimicrobium]